MMFPSISEHDRVYAIGDIHGRGDALIDLLRMILDDAAWAADERQTRIVFLGDYIDRGDDPARVIGYLRSLMSETGDGIVALKGNHEAALVDFLKDPIAGRLWLSHGARQTIASYGVPLPPTRPTPDDLRRLRDALATAMGDDIGFLAGLPTHYRLGSVLFTHAGCNPGLGDGTEDEHSLLWGHRNGLCDEPLPGVLLVHGHYESVDPVQSAGRISLDTGAWHTGRLTAVCIDSNLRFLSTRSATPDRQIEASPRPAVDDWISRKLRVPTGLALRLRRFSSPA